MPLFFRTNRAGRRNPALNPGWGPLRSLARILVPSPGRSLVVLLIGGLIAAGGFFFANGKVLRVADGDTVSVLTGRGPAKVRLYGIDCPETGQYGGPEATEFTRELLFLRSVTMSVMDTDQYGRTVALLKLDDGRIVNEELVRNGHAWVYRAHCKEAICARWLDLERQAKEQELGLWRRKKPIQPWQWRRSHPRR